MLIARRCAAGRRADKLAAARPLHAGGSPHGGNDDSGRAVETANPFSRRDLGARAASLRAAGVSARAHPSGRGAAAATAAHASASRDDGEGAADGAGEGSELELPAGWSAVWSDRNNCYYYVHEGGESSWSRPQE